jgi:hypothetical protein
VAQQVARAVAQDVAHQELPRAPANRSAADTQRLVRPWDRVGGVTNEMLQRAVAEGDVEVLRRMWQEAKVLEWVHASDDQAIAFLTLVHHAATSPGIHSPMAVLVTAIKGGMDTSRIAHEHEAWAAAVVKRRHQEANQ